MLGIQLVWFRLAGGCQATGIFADVRAIGSDAGSRSDVADELHARHVERRRARGGLFQGGLTLFLDHDGLRTQQVGEVDCEAAACVHPQDEGTGTLAVAKLHVARRQIRAGDGHDIPLQGENHPGVVGRPDAVIEKRLVQGDHIGMHRADAGCCWCGLRQPRDDGSTSRAARPDRSKPPAFWLNFVVLCFMIITHLSIGRGYSKNISTSDQAHLKANDR